MSRSIFEGSRQIYFVATMESDAGQADKHCRNLAAAKGMQFMGFAGIRMPDNCVYLSKMPTKSEAQAVIEASKPAMQNVANAIAAGQMLEQARTSALDCVKSGNAMHQFYQRFIETDKRYRVSDACMKCETCVRWCPVNNIVLVEGKPVFRGNCCACYACIHHCPTTAISIKGRSEGHGQYVCVEFRPENATIGKDGRKADKKGPKA